MVILGYTYGEMIYRKIGFYQFTNSEFYPKPAAYLSYSKNSLYGTLLRFANRMPRFTQLFFVAMYPYYYIFPSGFFLYFIPMLATSCMYRLFLDRNGPLFGFHNQALPLVVPADQVRARVYVCVCGFHL